MRKIKIIREIKKQKTIKTQIKIAILIVPQYFSLFIFVLWIAGFF
jgi:hypothetical protein